MSKFFVDYNTGAGNFEYEGTLDEAKKAAEEGLAYTQQSVKIFENDEPVAILPWWGTQPEEDEIVTCQFGSFGYYGEWTNDLLAN
jgi:hypothetical protein